MMNVSMRRTSIISFLFFVTTTFYVHSAAKKQQVEIKTIPQAIHNLNVAIKSVPYLDSSNMSVYEKEYADTMIKCAKVLYHNARNQILEALSEIDDRIAYWQYQKDHPWNYFVSKNPLKWITGPQQQDEIENNLEVLKSHQGELYVLLGNVSELGVTFTKGYKDAFLTDYHKGYEWVDSLLDVLVRIKIKEQLATDIPFIARSRQLKAKLDQVHEFKNVLLSDISETKIPSYIERNWLKAGAVLFGLNYGYQNYSDQIMNAATYGKEKSWEYFINPVTATLQDAITPGWRKPREEKTVLFDIDLARQSKREAAKNYLSEMGKKYELEAEAGNAVQRLAENDYSLYDKFVEILGEKDLTVARTAPIISSQDWVNRMKDYGRGLAIGGKAEAAKQIYDLVQYAYAQQKQYEQQYEAIGKLVLLIPAIVATGGLYTAYQKLTAKNYGPLRRALVDINSLFIDPSQQLNDEQYGKMIYLVHMLKKRAEKELPLKKNLRADFIGDLEKIESPDLSVVSKRAVIEDMFKKYSFLGLIQK